MGADSIFISSLKIFYLILTNIVNYIYIIYKYMEGEITMKTFGKIVLVIVIILLIVANVVTIKLWYDTNKKYDEIKTDYESMVSKYEETATALSELVEKNDAVEGSYGRDMKNVKIEVVPETVTNTGVEIVITDNNEVPYTWTENYTLERKVDDSWVEVTPVNEATFTEDAFTLDENNQVSQKINWTEIYGSLESGTYRVVKHVEVLNGDMYIQSNEFEVE